MWTPRSSSRGEHQRAGSGMWWLCSAPSISRTSAPVIITCVVLTGVSGCSGRPGLTAGLEKTGTLRPPDHSAGQRLTQARFGRH